MLKLMPKSGQKMCWRVNELRGVTSWIVSKWGGCGKLISWQVNQLTTCKLGCYNETEMDLESHRCIVNKQNLSLYLCVRVYGCHATHVLHSSNRHFPKTIVFGYNKINGLQVNK